MTPYSDLLVKVSLLFQDEIWFLDILHRKKRGTEESLRRIEADRQWKGDAGKEIHHLQHGYLRAGVSNIWPTGQIQPMELYDVACDSLD